MPIHRTMTRIIAALAAATASAVALPAHAAAEPTVTAPSPESVRAARPLFTIAAGASGEQVTDIALSTRSALDGGGRLAIAGDPTAVRLAIVAGQVQARPTSPLRAGRWHWQAWWTATDGTGATGTSAVTSFVVPAWMRRLRGAYTQMTESPAFAARGSVATNARSAVALCSVFAGRSLITRARVALRPDPARRTGFRCRGMRVPERLDGRLLTLRVVVSGGGRRAVATTRFTAT